MKIKQEDIGRLLAAVRDAGEDFFCAVGAAPSYAALTGAFAAADEKTLLLTPGSFVLPDGLPGESLAGRFGRENPSGYSVYALPGNAVAADVRLLGDAGFRQWCADARFSHILVPFAELADPTEYGARRAYGWIGEFRAELPRELRVTALFSQPLADYCPFLTRFASPGCTVLDASVPPSVYAYETANVRKKYEYTLYLAEKRAMRRVAVFFTNRREAEEFLRFLRSRGKRGLLFNGAMRLEEQKAALDAFQRGEGLLLATKSALPCALFYRADAVVFCGAPYSAAFLARCASFSAEGELECCFCPQDFTTDVNIIRYFAENRPAEEREDYLKTCFSRLLDVKRTICEPE